MIINIIIQARTSSRRYKSKILSNLFNECVILHLVKKLKRVNYINKVIVATSIENTDNKLCNLLNSKKIEVFRGSLNDVYSRYRMCTIINKCDFFIRISADSPFLNSRFLQYLVNLIKQNPTVDILSNTMKRLYPKGQSIEICNTKKFISLKDCIKKLSEKEHVTEFYYNNIKKFNFLSIQPKNNIDTFALNSCIDYPNDIFSKKKFLNNRNIKNLEKNFIIKKL